ncbi:MAG: transporter substrate-binding domain-containing protein [Prevotella sp.]|nr:transporter substrate-binding domain-containing protein [Prevotella sp.]
MKQTKLWLLAAIFCICGACLTTCCTSSDDNPVVETQQPTIQRIQERGKLLVGTTGDYRPLSYREANGNYWGFGIEMAEKIAKRIGVGIEFVQTSWPTLTADVMITEITEAPWYVQNDPRLAAPLLSAPFTHGEIGVLMRKGQDDLLALVNAVIAQMKADGTLRKLHEKYGLVYGY